MGSCRLAWLIALLGTGVLGCHREVHAPLLALGPLRADDPTLYDDAVRAAAESGHRPVRVDPEHGRFAVRANTDPSRETVFVVQCSRDGYITIVPQGGRVVRAGDEFELWPELRCEYAQFAIGMERLIPEAR